MRKDKWNGDLRSLRISVVNAVFGVGQNARRSEGLRPTILYGRGDPAPTGKPGI